MEFTSSDLYVYSIGISLTVAFVLLSRRLLGGKYSVHNLPPGPPGYPIVGNIFNLAGTMPNHKLMLLSKKYGPVMWMKLGMLKTVVISSAEASKELFKSHDLSFAGRAITDAMRSNDLHESSLAIGQHGPYWRMLRRVANTELFTAKKMSEMAHLRRKCVDNMIKWVEDEARRGGSIEIAKFVFLVAFNILTNLIFSREADEINSLEDSEFFKLSTKIVALAGEPNVSDNFPQLSWLDLQGIRKKMDNTLGRVLDIVGGLVEERLQAKDVERKKKDFLDVLLDYEDESGKKGGDKLTRKNICAFIVELFIAGTESTNSTIEWAMTELLRNKEAMKKVQDEIAQVIGRSRKVEESDIPNLPYLRAVLKETLRLHPPVPFLIPRRAMEDVDFMGFTIPKDSQILINIWAIGRDPQAWDEPLAFKPERFFESKNADIDYKGHHYQFMPFGAGRRICAGMSLGEHVLHLVLASLLQCFDWAVDGDAGEVLDMGERIGTAFRKAVPLKVFPKSLMANV